MRRRGGFTLLEVLVALGIFGVVVAIVSATFSGALGAQAAADRRAATTHAGRTALDRITQDLLSAFPRAAAPPGPPAGGQSPGGGGQQAGPRAPSHGGLTLEDRETEGAARDRLTFYTYARPLGGPTERASDQAQVEYDLVVSDDRRDWRLVRRQTSRTEPGAAAQAEGDVLAERVVGFDVRVYDPARNEWLATWTDGQGGLPRAVRVTVQVAPEPPAGAHRPWGDGPLREAALLRYTTQVVLPLAPPPATRP